MRSCDLIPLGSLPESPSDIPEKMTAYVLRSEHMGELRKETVNVPDTADDEVLVAVKSAGINYNNVWSAYGIPFNVIDFRKKRGESEDFHIPGSDASGIVCRTGKNVRNLRFGDPVVIHAGFWDESDPWIRKGGDPILSETCRAWGYETNYGSLAQFAKVKAHQCLPKPEHLSWEEASVYMLSGATAYRMLTHWLPNRIKKGEIVFIWGGAGGLGTMAIQLARVFGAVPIAGVSDSEKKDFCLELGAEAVVCRKDFSHWGKISEDSLSADSFWRKETEKFRDEILSASGGKSPSIVIEHPGEPTLPVSMHICRKGGMTVICGGTGGYAGSFDLKEFEMGQKRLQGSHFADTEECRSLNQLVIEKKINPVLGEIFRLDQINEALNKMKMNSHRPGSMAVRIA